MKRDAALIAVAGLWLGALPMVRLETPASARLRASSGEASPKLAPHTAASKGGDPTYLKAQAILPAQSVWDGVYTLAQAKRGALKSGLCTSCHGDGFVGGTAPELAGAEFLSRWEGRSVADLFDLIRLTMPDDDPGALPREQYADLIAYILAVNKFPEGRVEIGTAIDPLKTIRILATKP